MKRRLLSKGKKYDNMGMIEVGGRNMKRSKGFTLIELLAVIVILAIIALIATPIILNIINDSREKSNQRSVEGLGKAVETTIGEIMMDSDYTGSDIACKLGSNISPNEISKDNMNDIDEDETYCWDIGNPEGTIKKVTYSGSRVKAGSITFNQETGKVSIADAQVGSSSKTYTTEGLDSAISVIASKLDPDDDSIFRDHYGNIRYRGLNPNNYVTFNDESWRIIGIIDGKVKLIRATSIGDYSWDSSVESVNGGGGVNEWSQADLMKLLNPGYESEIIGGSLYWNRKGDNTTKCYTEWQNTISECDFSSTSETPGLTEEAKQMIDKSVWYLGGHDENPVDITLDNMYIMIDREKGTNVYTTTGGTYDNDGITRTTRWTGYVGLMYPSDYGYAADKSCSKDLYNYGQEDACSKTGNWLYHGINNYNEEWLLTPHSNDSNYVWYMSYFGGVVKDDEVIIGLIVRPVLNLKSNVKITNLDSADGSESKPYELSL